jgi:hypothetical protein
MNPISLIQALQLREFHAKRFLTSSCEVNAYFIVATSAITRQNLAFAEFFVLLKLT